MPKTKVEVYDKDQLIYPYIESDHVTFSNGMKVSEMLDQSISMPKVIHEDLSFKVGVGDQDVSSAIVDSSVAKMTIKGKTYQNILPEPSTHVLTNNKEMFKVNEGLDPNVEIVDGVSKSAILSGSTKYRDISSNKIYDSYETATQVWSTNKYKLWCAQDGGTTSELNGTIASGTDIVTLDFHAINHSTYKLTGNCTYKKVAFYDSNQTFISSTRTAATTGDLVINNIPSNARYVRFAFFPYADNTGSCSIVDENNNPINLRQIQLISCKLPVLQTVGKNLFDGKLEKGFINGSGGYGTSTTAVRSTNYIRVTPNTKYIINSNDYTGSVYVHEYDADHNHTNQIAVKSFTTSSNTHYVKFNTHTNTDLDVTTNFQFEEGSTVTSYEPYKTNILHTPEEVVLRSLPNGGCDTLNCMTGEYVQRIKEVVFDGSSDESIGMVNVNDTTLVRFNINNVAGVQTGNANKVLCSSLPYLYIHGLSGGSATVSQECISNHSQDANVINIVIKRSRLSSVDVAGFRAYLQSNPITIQYSIATPVVKAVDLSSSGNWEKVVYNGMESWNKHDTWSSGELLAMHTSCRGKLVAGLAFSDKFDGMKFSEASSNSVATKECIRYDAGSATIYVFIKKSRLQESSIDGFKQWLKDNGLTVWYQTETHLDSTQVKQPIFFKDGHIQLSSGADNSLIPTLDYQAKTSNSYVMDLMKANTRYTMKAKSASGTFTIDGTSYGAVTNGTFTTPSSMTNKLLVMSNKTNTEVMILEGDVTSKTIPYFKGIKSAFESEDKIEVLSTGKNLFTFSKLTQFNSYGMKATVDGETLLLSGTPTSTWAVFITKNVLEVGKTYTVSYYENGIFSGNYKLWGRDKDGNLPINHRSGQTFTLSSEIVQLEVVVENLIVGEPVNKQITIQIEEVSTSTSYEPYKSNNTKIPLLSPLRSLPNGMYDELIIDRMKNKATLIQRVKSTVFNGSENWSLNGYSHDKLVEFVCHGGVQMAHTIFSDRFTTGGENVERVAFSGGSIYIRILKTKVSNVDSFKKWLSQNPLTVQCGLQTPVITEVDLEGFPYIYKDGHIFLNSEIVPTMENTYSINQGQQISASNEDIIRHEKELTYLQKLIAQYVQVDYESVLLSLKV